MRMGTSGGKRKNRSQAKGKQAAVTLDEGYPDKPRIGAFSIAAVTCIAALVLFQGGYYEATSLIVACAFACTLAVCLAVRCRRNAEAGALAPGLQADRTSTSGILSLAMPACFVGVCLAEAVSSQVNGLPLPAALHSAPWVLAALGALAGIGVSRGAVAACADVLAWAGVASGALGVLMVCGIVPFPGSMLAERLQFTFQYANTAGLWFSVCAVFALSSRDERLRWLSVLPISGLALTLSMGSVAVFALSAAALLARWAKLGQGDRFASLACACLLAAIMSVSSMLAGGVAALVAAALSTCICCALAGMVKLLAGLRKVARARWLAPACAALLAAAAVAAGIVASDRLAQASQTFAERFVQMGDAATLLSSDPLWGIGPGQWRYQYESVQSVDYIANVVHSGYFQVALDGGLVALLLLVAGAACGLVAAMRRRGAGKSRSRDNAASPAAPSEVALSASADARFAIALAIGMILLHAAIDIDFSFSSITLLLGFLLAIL